MNKPTDTKTGPYEYPKGTHMHWKGDGPFQAANLAALCAPTVAVAKATHPLTFEGSLDGKSFGVLRDKDGDVFRITKSGLYRLPVAVVWLRPVCEGSVDISTFIQVRG